MKLILIPAMAGSLAVLSACAGGMTEKDVGCAGATVVGAVVGGALGNQLGGGTGKDILTAGGAVAGGAVANNAAGC
jgi:uncharacterized protein YcfJ